MQHLYVLFVFASFAWAQAPDAAKQALIARAKSLELKTPYEPAPGSALSHEAAGYAKIVCSAVFISGFTEEFAEENLGYFVAPYADRKQVGKPQVDRKAKTVSVALPDGTSRLAKYLGDQGCVAVPPGKSGPYFKPVRVKSELPDGATQPWPMGDAAPTSPLPIDMTKLNAAGVDQAMDAAFARPAAMTAAVVVTWKGRIIGERYGDHVTKSTPLESWSMGKSITATLMGILIQQGAYKLDQPAPIPEWSAPNDPRRAIRIADLLHMSSGLRIKAPADPDYDPHAGYADHLYLYTGETNLFHYAATRPQQWPPNTVGRYRNTDPLLTNYLIRLAVEKRGEDYLSFPRKALFDKLGMRNTLIETDNYGNFLTQGYDFASARDWARLGNLYLQDGVWNGQRILPEGFVKFVSTVAPAWALDKRPQYGGFFWINGMNQLAAPKETYYMSGAGGQYVLIEPSRELVVVRLGHFKGDPEAMRSLNDALRLLMDAVPVSSASSRTR